MVSNAREDLPDPDRPVITVSLSRGMTTSTFLRLCSRAPRTWILPAFDWAMNPCYPLPTVLRMFPVCHSPGEVGRLFAPCLPHVVQIGPQARGEIAPTP